MLVLIWLAAPATVAALLALITRVRWERAYILFGVGIALAIGYVLLVYLHAPLDYQHSQGDDDGQMYWGRWWEPQWTSFVAIVGYVSWAMGTVVGLLVRGALDLLFRAPANADG
jgi:hypothetical protein